MNTLPWHRPEEKPEMYKLIGVVSEEGFDTAQRNMDGIELHRTDGYAESIALRPEQIKGWLYESDLLADFTRWQSGEEKK